MADRYLIKGGLYTQTFIENLAMSIRLGILTPAEFTKMQTSMRPDAISKHLSELILANAPAYRAKRQAENA